MVLGLSHLPARPTLFGLFRPQTMLVVVFQLPKQDLITGYSYLQVVLAKMLSFQRSLSPPISVSRPVTPLAPVLGCQRSRSRSISVDDAEQLSSVPLLRQLSAEHGTGRISLIEKQALQAQVRTGALLLGGLAKAKTMFSDRICNCL